MPGAVACQQSWIRLIGCIAIVEFQFGLTHDVNSVVLNLAIRCGAVK